MWWNEQIVVWREMFSFPREIPLLALIAIADAVTGISRIAATRLGIEKREDIILLAILLVCAIRFLFWGDFLPHRHVVLEAPNDVAEWPAYLHRLGILAFYNWFLPEVQVCSAIACGVMARLQGRSFFLWILIGFLGNVGSVIWLLLRRRAIAKVNAT